MRSQKQALWSVTQPTIHQSAHLYNTHQFVYIFNTHHLSNTSVIQANTKLISKTHMNYLNNPTIIFSTDIKHKDNISVGCLPPTITQTITPYPSPSSIPYPLRYTSPLHSPIPRRDIGPVTRKGPGTRDTLLLPRWRAVNILDQLKIWKRKQSTDEYIFSSALIVLHVCSCRTLCIHHTCALKHLKSDRLSRSC